MMIDISVTIPVDDDDELGVSENRTYLARDSRLCQGG